jgi:hypothetical protein
LVSNPFFTFFTRIEAITANAVLAHPKTSLGRASIVSSNGSLTPDTATNHSKANSMKLIGVSRSIIIQLDTTVKSKIPDCDHKKFS